MHTLRRHAPTIRLFQIGKIYSSAPDCTTVFKWSKAFKSGFYIHILGKQVSKKFGAEIPIEGEVNLLNLHQNETANVCRVREGKLGC